MRTVLLVVSCVVACVRPDAAPQPVRPVPRPATQSQRTVESSPEDAREPEAVASQSPSPSEAAPAGCWETTFGAGPRPGATPPSLQQPLPGCPDCTSLKAGPLVAGLHPEVIQRLRAVERTLPAPAVDEPVMWVNSGAREGPPGASMHNQALAVDVVVCGFDTAQTAQRLREVGFTCVIEYFAADGTPCHMAHGDLRGTPHARGAYGVNGRKAGTCPGRAVAPGDSCQQFQKSDWNYGTAKAR